MIQDIDMNKNKTTYRIPKAVYFTVVLILAAVMIISAVKKDRKLTYSLYPYLPETEYCTDILEKEYPVYARLKNIAGKPDNKLFRAYGTFMDETYGR